MKNRRTNPRPAPLLQLEQLHAALRLQTRKNPSGEAIPVETVMLPSEWANVALGFIADPVQASVLDGNASRLLLLTTRQWGKSSVAALRALWQATFFPGSLILVVAPTGRQSAELLNKLAAFAAKLGVDYNGGGLGRLGFRFSNGSRVIGLSEAPDNIRGFSAPHLVIVDEAAFFSGSEILDALLPMLATQPQAGLWLMSTPSGPTGFFYETWRDTAGPWTRVEVPASAVPHRISPEFLAEQQRRDPEKFRREFNCEFVAGEGSLFDRIDVEALLTPDVDALDLKQEAFPS